MKMKMFFKPATIALVLAAATTSVALAYSGYHGLMVKTVNEARSISVRYTQANGYLGDTCRSKVTGNTWVYIGTAKNGTKVRVEEFTGSSCDGNSVGAKTYTVPGSDGLDNFWINYPY